MIRSVIVVVRRGSKILMGKRTKRYGFGEYQFPGGKIDEKEDAEKAALRELFEETGLRAKNLLYLTNVYKHDEEGNESYFNIIFETTDAVGEPVNKEPSKCAGWEWFDIRNLPQPIFEADRALEDYVYKVKQMLGFLE